MHLRFEGFEGKIYHWVLFFSINMQVANYKFISCQSTCSCDGFLVQFIIAKHDFLISITLINSYSDLICNDYQYIFQKCMCAKFSSLFTPFIYIKKKCCCLNIHLCYMP